MSDPSWFVRVVQEKLAEIRLRATHKPGLEHLHRPSPELLEAVAKGLNNDQRPRVLGLGDPDGAQLHLGHS